MIEDELLKRRFKCGSQEALARIYDKYLDYLLTLAMALLGDKGMAEDVVHDVFVSFARSANDFKLRGSLRSYLATCVVNRARDQIRTSQRRDKKLDKPDFAGADSSQPDQLVICSEQAQRLNRALAQLPLDQREAVTLRIKGQMRFKDIASLQGVSVNTIRGRYRYGLGKLRSILDHEVER
jgi:RNA polymerase sigma factor (sigma-70 family)